jgi:hypothetical protein
MDVGPDAAQRAHAGRAREITVEAGLRLADAPHRTTLFGEVALDAQRRHQPVGYWGGALDAEARVRGQALDDGAARHRGDVHARESRRQGGREPLGRQELVERVGHLYNRRHFAMYNKVY